jgi:hypothetical protein
LSDFVSCAENNNAAPVAAPPAAPVDPAAPDADHNDDYDNAYSATVAHRNTGSTADSLSMHDSEILL